MTHALQSFWAAFVGGFVGAIATDGIRRVRCSRHGGHACSCPCNCIECRNGHHEDCPFECVR